MSANIGDETFLIGEQIKYWRSRRGKSQRALAGLAGLSQPYLSQIESGARQVEKRSVLVALAGALQVSVAELTGQPGDPTDPMKAKATISVPAIREALIMRSAGVTVPAPARRDVSIALRSIAAADYTTLGPMLPGLIGGAVGADLVQVGYTAISYLHYTGYGDLAREAARLVLDDARDRDDPTWLGMAEYVNAISLPPETAGLTVDLACRAARALQPHLADPQARQVYGMLHLTAALRSAAARRATDALFHLDEAAGEAATLGEPRGGGLCLTAFGPTNVDIWRMAVLGELGDDEQGVAIAGQITPDRTPVPHRAAAYWIDLGHMLANLGRDDEAVEAFLRAEAITPQWVRLRRTVRDSIAVIVRRTRRNAVSGPLRQAAEIVGLHAHLN